MINKKYLNNSCVMFILPISNFIYFTYFIKKVIKMATFMIYQFLIKYNFFFHRNLNNNHRKPLAP